MPSHLLLLTVDPSIGKLSKDTLTQQTQMELLVKDVQNFKDAIRGDFDDIHDWGGVEFDANTDVVALEWTGIGMIGTIELMWIPRTVNFIDMCINEEMCGTLDTHELPCALQQLYLHETALDGTVDFTKLPRALELFDIHRNSFCGSADLTMLPPKMRHLSIFRNCFSGTINVTALPVTMKKVFLGNNNFYGKTDFSRLPRKITNFDISNTQLEGEIISTGRTLHIENSKVTALKAD